MLQPAAFAVPVRAPSLIARAFTNSQGARYGILVNMDTKKARQFQWGGEPGAPSIDVLTGARISKTISLQPGGGMVVEMK